MRKRVYTGEVWVANMDGVKPLQCGKKNPKAKIQAKKELVVINSEGVHFRMNAALNWVSSPNGPNVPPSRCLWILNEHHIWILQASLTTQSHTLLVQMQLLLCQG